MKNKTRNEMGISLVALVVTIVILTILAGISIKVLMGENGLIEKAQRSKENVELVEAKKQEKINELTKYKSGETTGYATKYDLIEEYQEQINELRNEIASTSEGGTASAQYILKDYTAYSNGELVTGTMDMLTSSNFTGVHSSSAAGADSNYIVTSISAGYVPNDTIVDTLTATTSPTIATTAATGTKTIDIKPGYYNKISVNQTNAYNAGVASISGGDATATQILKSKTAYVGGVKVTGTMTNNGKVTKTINPGGSYTIPEGYHNGQGTVTANANQNSGTYTYPVNSTGAKYDMGVNNTNRYVDATNVYNKGKADGALSGSFTKLYDTGLVENNASFSYKFSSGVKDAIIILSSISNYTYDGAQPAISVPSGTVTILDWASERAQDTNNTFRSYIKVYYLKDAGGKTVSGKVHYRGRVYIGKLT